MNGTPAPAPLGRRLAQVLAVDELGPYRLLRLADPGGPPPLAGQFAMLAAAERWGGGEDERPYLPRALSVARRRGHEAQFLLEDVGPGSRRLCELEAGEPVWVLGPLGSCFTVPAGGRRPILVGGGVGMAPLVALQDALERAGSNTRATVLLGFRDAPRARAAELMRAPRIVTDDGSLGDGGLVSDLLLHELDTDAHAQVYACGPAPMLEAVRALCHERDLPAQLALEAPMACGFGACHGCVVPTRDGRYVRACLEGPVLDAGLLARVEAHAGAPA